MVSPLLFTIALAVGVQPALAAVEVAPSTLQACVNMMDGKLPQPIPSNFHFSGNVRKYYVSAEEVMWDYAPTGWDNWLGVPFDKSPRVQMAGANTYGTKFLKALYRGYTDSSFSHYSAQPAFQGIQGPSIRAETGDLIEILFVNKLSTYYATMHSMGLSYTKFEEGSDYPNNTSPGQESSIPVGSAVPPGGGHISPGSCTVYKWLVDDHAGPPAGQPARVHSYHSYVAYEMDSNAGLIGPTIIYGRGLMASTMAGYREFPLLYNIFDESNSWLSGTNKARITGKKVSAPTVPNLSSGNHSIWYPQAVNLAGSGQWSDGPQFNAMNGYVFANNPLYEACLNDKVIWYVNAYGADSHSFHMHGNNFNYNGFPFYAMDLNDGEGKTLYMDATGGGKWQVICHVSDHQTMGMVSDYMVYPAGKCPLTPLRPTPPSYP